MLFLLVFEVSYSISTLSTKEKQLISAHIKRFDAEYDCTHKRIEAQKKLDTYIKRKAPEHIIEAMRSKIDTEVKAECESHSKTILVGSTLFRKCLCNYKLSSFDYYYRMYKAYTSGFLPFKGCYVEQPSKVIEIITFIEYTYNEVMAEMSRRQK